MWRIVTPIHPVSSVMHRVTPVMHQGSLESVNLTRVDVRGGGTRGGEVWYNFPIPYQLHRAHGWRRQEHYFLRCLAHVLGSLSKFSLLGRELSLGLLSIYLQVNFMISCNLCPLSFCQFKD